MEPLRTARALAVLNTAVQAAVLGLAQSAYDDPRRVRRFWTGVALAVGGGATLAASDAVWTATTRDRTASADPDVVLQAHDATMLLRQLGLTAAAVPVWVLGRGLPERLRRRGVTHPNRLLAVPLAIGWAAAASRVEQAHARDRTAALELTGRQH